MSDEIRFIGLFTRFRSVRGLPIHAIRISRESIFFEDGPYAGSGLVPGSTVWFDKWPLNWRWFFVFVAPSEESDARYFIPMRGGRLYRHLVRCGWDIRRVTAWEPKD